MDEIIKELSCLTEKQRETNLLSDCVFFFFCIS